jgi:uncharacterized SAM-binding protein YcdF (DUF218 family)
MFLLKKILASLVLPPTGPLLLAFFGLWLERLRPRAGRWLTAFAACLLLLLSLPWCSHMLLRGLEDTSPISPETLAQGQAIVILGGGTYHEAPEYRGDTVNHLGLERLRYGARLARTSDLPVAVVGGILGSERSEAEMMRETLVSDFAIPVRWLEVESRDTAENAAKLVPILNQAGISRIVLVTHAWHMRRARGQFEHQGLQVLPAPTSFATTSQDSLINWLPGAGAMYESQLALHEWLGLLVDRLSGVGAAAQAQ